MLDLLNEMNHLSFFSIVGVSFIIGAISSVHCLGMCGPVMLMSSTETKDKVFYQFGRLFSYLLLIFILSFFRNEMIALLSGSVYFTAIFIAVGVIFILYGLSLISKVSIKFDWLQKVYQRLFSKVIKVNKSFRSLTLGALSILLPCSTLYLFILGVIGFLNPMLASLAVITFWIPTSLSLIFGTEFFNVFIKKKAPHFYGAFFVCFGILTIILRLNNWSGLEALCN